MFAPSNRVRLGIAVIVLCSPFLQAQQKKPSESVCGCPDGRQFAVGASMYGKRSARVLITGLRPDPPQVARLEFPRCPDVLVLAQPSPLLTPHHCPPSLPQPILNHPP